MHAQIAKEEGLFGMEDILYGVAEKMIRRHPHVFGTGRAEDSGQVLANWEEIKRQEHSEKTAAESMRRVAKALPAAIRAEKIQRKLRRQDMNLAVSLKIFPELRNLLKNSKIVKFPVIGRDGEGI